MTIDEFKALQQGDKIRNEMTDSSGTVSHVEHRRGRTAVDVQWEGSLLVYGFIESSCAWMHWERAS